VSYGRTIKDILFRKEFFLFMLLADLWKGNKCSYKYSEHIMKQIEWINKTRREIKGRYNKDINNAFIGITLMSESQLLDKAAFLKKYEMKFKLFADSIRESKTGPDLEAYYMLSFIAGQCGIEELKVIAKKTYWKLEEKYPELPEIVKKEMEKQQTNSYEEENELMRVGGVRAA
jgi:hypothetical protein